MEKKRSRWLWERTTPYASMRSVRSSSLMTQIDRHIRALDSALSAHEASILLGLRADTNPSAAVEPGEQIDAAPDVAADQEQVTIGMGGGGSRKRKGKKGKKADAVAAVEQPAELPGPLFDLDIDP